MPDRQLREPPPVPRPLPALTPAPSPTAGDPASAATLRRVGPAATLALQRAIGNAAVGRLLTRVPAPGKTAPSPDLLDPSDQEWDQMEAALKQQGEQLRKQLIDTISGRDWVLFTSRLRALTAGERFALTEDAEFWKQLRGYLSGVSYWFVRLRLEYGEQTPPEVRELSTAIWSGDWHRTRTLLFGYESLRKVPGLREVIVSKFPPPQADDLRAILAETHTRAESWLKHYNEAHYEGGQIQKMVGDRSYELVRTDRYLRVVVRIGLAEDPGNATPAITDKVISRWESTISQLWNGKFRLRSDARTLDVWFVPVFVYHDDNAHHQVKVAVGGARSDETDWHAEDAGQTAAHEFGHMLGNPDEYNLPGATPEIPASLGLTPDEARRSSWEGLTGTKRSRDTAGYDVSALMGNHYRSTAVYLRYLDDIVATFNAKLRGAGESAWTAEMQA